MKRVGGVVVTWSCSRSASWCRARSVPTRRATRTRRRPTSGSHDEIRIAVVADVDNPFVPGLFQGAVDGVNGAAKYINANGGIGGRKVQVDFIDSKLNANEARERDHHRVRAGLRARRDRGVPVRTSTTTINWLQGLCGQGHGHPRPRCVRDRRPRGGARRSGYPINPSRLTVRPRISQSPQTYRTNNGDAKYLLKKNPGSLHGSFVLAERLAVGGQGDNVQSASARSKPASSRTVRSPATRPQSQYTPIIQQMKTDNSN